MRKICKKFILLLVILALLSSACQSSGVADQPSSGKKTIVVTYSILGAIVKDLVGDTANVVVLIPNGQDPHEWEPSAKDIETVNKADLIVQNGLSLEGGLTKTLDQAQSNGVKFFTASDAITVRRVGKGEGIPNGDADQNIGAPDPHIWLDPLDMKAIVKALALTLKHDLGIDVSARATDLQNRLEALNVELATEVQTLPPAKRKLVTGHESMGYFAQRYGFQLIGAIIPSLTTQAEVSASDLATLKQLIETNRVKAVFTELGTPSSVADAIGQETGAKVIQISTHVLPADGSYFSLMRTLTKTIVEALR
jgi:zinc/manganese transport system substrate-binding protein